MRYRNYSTFPAKHGDKKHLIESDIYIDIKSKKHIPLNPDGIGRFNLPELQNLSGVIGIQNIGKPIDRSLSRGTGVS